MSNRKKLRLIAVPMEIPGGCDSCDAYQTVETNHYGPGMHRLDVHHDNWCPVLARHRSSMN